MGGAYSVFPVLEKWMQDYEVQASLDYKVRPYLNKTRTKTSQQTKMHPHITAKIKKILPVTKNISGTKPMSDDSGNNLQKGQQPT